MLSPVKENKSPSSRTVSLKGVDETGYFFFTNFGLQR